MKLHPDARPKREDPAHLEYDGLADLCRAVISMEGWDPLFQVHQESGSSVVKITYEPRGEFHHEPPIVFTTSEERFARGAVTRQEIRNTCRRYLRER